VRVVSEGLDAYVLPVLARMGAPEVEVSCNRLVEGPGGARILPPPDGEPCARCLNCKGAHARRGRAGGMRVAIVGNGASDLCAAREADLVLARDTLALLCRAEGIPCQPWDDLAEVRAAIEAAV
jgi:2-hydroxy-3-keto-5-methylthiopentenyl-1-phosphate phosphatase